MKKTIFTLILFALLANVSAQLKVNSSGQVGIGAKPTELLQINGGALKIGNYDDFVKINQASGTLGVRVEYDKTTPALPFTAYRNGSQVFLVDDIGLVFSRGVLLTSDFSLKNNIEPIANPLDKVMKLQGLSFDLNSPGEDNLAFLSPDSLFKYTQKRTPNITREIFDQIQQEKSRKRLGIIAQDVEKILPELVRTREDGLKAVFYPELVAVLIEAIKEQQTQIGELQAVVFSGQLRSESFAEETVSIDISNKTIVGCKLYQNIPNPFSQDTRINYFLPETIGTAYLCIYDLQGKQLKQYLLTERGEGIQQVLGNEFAPGIYLYALIADGQEVDVKRMILTE